MAALTKEQTQRIIKDLGYTGSFGAGGAQAFLNSDPRIKKLYDARIANAQATGKVDYSASKFNQALKNNRGNLQAALSATQGVPALRGAPLPPTMQPPPGIPGGIPQQMQPPPAAQAPVPMQAATQPSSPATPYAGYGDAGISRQVLLSLGADPSKIGSGTGYRGQFLSGLQGGDRLYKERYAAIQAGHEPTFNTSVYNQQLATGITPQQAAQQAQAIRGNPATGTTANPNAGGVVPVGRVEDFNQWQKDALTNMAKPLQGAAPMGFMQNLRELTTRGMDQNPNATSIFNKGESLYGDARTSLGQGQQELTAPAFQQGIGMYMNPYQENVIDRSVARINENADAAQSNLMANTRGRRSFGDSSSAIQLAELQKNRMNQIADTTANLSQSGFNTAAGMTTDQFNQARARNLQGAQLGGQMGGQRYGEGAQAVNALTGIASMAEAGNKMNLANNDYANNINSQNIQRMLAAGTMSQQQAQSKLDAAKAEMDYKRNWDMMKAGNLTGLLTQFPSSSINAAAQPGTPSPMSTFANVMGTIAPAFQQNKPYDYQSPLQNQQYRPPQ